MARRLYRNQVVDGVYRRDEGAVRDPFCHFLQALGVLALMAHVQGQGRKRARVPGVQDRLR